MGAAFGGGNIVQMAAGEEEEADYDTENAYEGGGRRHAKGAVGTDDADDDHGRVHVGHTEVHRLCLKVVAVADHVDAWKNAIEFDD